MKKALKQIFNERLSLQTVATLKAIGFVLVWAATLVSFVAFVLSVYLSSVNAI